MYDYEYWFTFQCATLLEWGETFVFHVVSREFQLEQPKPSVTCQHGVDQRTCDAKVQHQRSPIPDELVWNM